MLPRPLQDAPSALQDDPRCSQKPPRTPKLRPPNLPDLPNDSQEASKSPSESPRWLQETPKSPPRAPQGVQKCFKRLPHSSQEPSQPAFTRLSGTILVLGSRLSKHSSLPSSKAQILARLDSLCQVLESPELLVGFRYSSRDTDPQRRPWAHTYVYVCICFYICVYRHVC